MSSTDTDVRMVKKFASTQKTPAIRKILPNGNTVTIRRVPYEEEVKVLESKSTLYAYTLNESKQTGDHAWKVIKLEKLI